jgi:transposase DDE domain
MELPSLISSLSLIDDQRSDKNKHYPLPLLLLIAFCASISKHDSWYTMQDYAQAHEASLRELYKQLFGEELEHVTPTHDTLNRALQVIPHQVFKRAYQDWIAALLRWDEETRQICIDGKTMHGVKKLSPDTESHIVSAYDPHLQLVLSVDAVPVKRNELDSIRRLLDELDVTDALISLDALGCQRQIAEQVLEVGSHYLFQVKSNQPTLLQELEDSFPKTNKGFTLNKEEDLGHGRIEMRQMKSLVLSHEMLEDSYAFKDWAEIKSIHQLSRKRYDKRSGKETIEISYYISSVEDSKRVFRAIRDHWKIENQLHYMLDVYLGEDGWSKRAGEAAKNMELLAKIDLFILQRLKTKLGKSIPRVQMLLAKLNPLQLFDLEL